MRQASENRRRKERIVKKTRDKAYEILHRTHGFLFSRREVQGLAKDAGIRFHEGTKLLKFAKYFEKRWHEFETFCYAA